MTKSINRPTPIIKVITKQDLIIAKQKKTIDFQDRWIKNLLTDNAGLKEEKDSMLARIDSYEKRYIR